MENRQAERNPGSRIDAGGLWLSVRVAEIFLAVIFAKLAYLTRGAESFVANAISSGILMLVIALFWHRFVTGSADSSGIHYRRYLRWKTVLWADVQEVQWKGARLRVLIRGKKKPKAILEFLLDPLRWTSAYWAHRLGGDVSPPEILERIRALQVEAPPTLVSAPPMSRWLVRLAIAVGVFFLVVMLFRLLVPLGNSH